MAKAQKDKWSKKKTKKEIETGSKAEKLRKNREEWIKA